MTPRVSCDDCAWSDDVEDLLEASDRAEEHEAKEQHRVSIERVATDGGASLPEPSDWPFDAVVHGVDRVYGNCLAVTGSGKPCTNHAYGDPLCGLHQDAEDPSLMRGAHQWARIVDGDDVVAVCVNCAAVWDHGVPALAVECATCGAGAGERCGTENSAYSGAGKRAPIPAHYERRREAWRRDVYHRCRQSPLAVVDEDQETLIADGGTAMLADHESCTGCGRQVSGQWDYCAGCGHVLGEHTLEHAEEYVPLIIRSDKDATVRYGSDGADLRVGDEVVFVDEDGEVFGRATIIRTATVAAVEALEVLRLWGAEYPHDDVDDLIAGVDQHYADPIRPSTGVRVLQWTNLTFPDGVRPDA